MRVLFLLTVLLLPGAAQLSSAAGDAFGQQRKPVTRKTRPAAKKAGKTVKTAAPPVPVYEDEPPPPPRRGSKQVLKEAASSDVFEVRAVGKWGVAELNLPHDLEAETPAETSRRNGDVSWTDYSRIWKLPSANETAAGLEVEISVTTWDRGDFTFVPDLRADLATPENLLLLDLIGDEKNKNAADSHVKESRPMEVGGVRGGFFRVQDPPEGGRFLAGWYTYRIFGGKAQRISLTVTGGDGELEKAMRIISSLKLQ